MTVRSVLICGDDKGDDELQVTRIPVRASVVREWGESSVIPSQ